jgi:peptidoglycan hydrolase-like protein with peptidoglycan-binding domain
MRKPLHKTAHLALTLLLVVGVEVGASFAQAQTASQQKPSTASKSRASAHRTKTSRKSRRRERGQKAPTPDRISEIQQALAKDGSFSGTPNGKWDDATVDAMKKFQESHGLNPTGKLDAKTLQQLGLGSQTAGAAPPLPPVSSKTAAVAPAQTARKQQ